MSKVHVLRAPQTDRYSLTVPTKLSELEDDLPLLSLVTVRRFTGAAPTTEAFQAPTSVWTGSAGTQITEGTIVIQNRLFGVSTSGNLAITVPQTGMYALSLTVQWRGNGDTSFMVGYLATPFDVILTTNCGLSLTFDGTMLFNNKMAQTGITTGAGTEQKVLLQTQAIQFLTAGDVIAPEALLSYDPALASPNVFAIANLNIVRIG